MQDRLLSPLIFYHERIHNFLGYFSYYVIKTDVIRYILFMKKREELIDCLVAKDKNDEKTFINFSF